MFVGEGKENIGFGGNIGERDGGVDSGALVDRIGGVCGAKRGEDSCEELTHCSIGVRRSLDFGSCERSIQVSIKSSQSKPAQSRKITQIPVDPSYENS